MIPKYWAWSLKGTLEDRHIENKTVVKLLTGIILYRPRNGERNTGLHIERQFTEQNTFWKEIIRIWKKIETTPKLQDTWNVSICNRFFEFVVFIRRNLYFLFHVSQQKVTNTWKGYIYNYQIYYIYCNTEYCCTWFQGKVHENQVSKSRSSLGWFVLYRLQFCFGHSPRIFYCILN